jgi:hypothetical protein
MRIEIHIHTEDTDILRGEKRDFQGQIAIPGTEATLNHYGLTSDKSYGRATDYIINCWLHGEVSEVDEITNWLYSKIKDKAVKITIGDLKGKSDYCKIDKEEISKILNEWLKD